MYIRFSRQWKVLTIGNMEFVIDHPTWIRSFPEPEIVRVVFLKKNPTIFWFRSGRVAPWNFVRIQWNSKEKSGFHCKYSKELLKLKCPISKWIGNKFKIAIWMKMEYFVWNYYFISIIICVESKPKSVKHIELCI